MDGTGAISEVVAAGVEDLGLGVTLTPDDAVQLAGLVLALYRDACVAVCSVVGLSLVCTVHDEDAVLTAFRPAAGPADVRASLGIPFCPAALTGDRHYLVVLYAHQPQAFADLATGLRSALGSAGPQLLLDRHLHAPASTPFREVSHVSQAQGVLVGRGFSEVGAQTFLKTLATSAGLGEAARSVLGPS